MMEEDKGRQGCKREKLTVQPERTESGKCTSTQLKIMQMRTQIIGTCTDDWNSFMHIWITRRDICSSYRERWMETELEQQEENNFTEGEKKEV